MKPHQELDPIDNATRGRDPREMSVEELNELGHHKRSLLSAIRQNCIECCGGYTAEVRRCGAIECPMWPYRMNNNPFVTRQLSDEQKAAGAERLAQARARMAFPGD